MIKVSNDRTLLILTAIFLDVQLLLLASLAAMAVANTSRCGYMRVDTPDGGEQFVKYMPEDKYQKYCIERYNPHLRNREDREYWGRGRNQEGGREGGREWGREGGREGSRGCCPCNGNIRSARFARVDDDELGSKRNCRPCPEKCQGGRRNGNRGYGEEEQDQAPKESWDDQESAQDAGENIRQARSPRQSRSRRNNGY